MTESMLYRQAFQEGQEIARVEVRRENLLLVVNAYYPGAVPTDYLNRIRSQESYHVLDAWFQAAIRATNVEEFLTVMRR
jgi:hypothetical protein